MHRKAQVVHRLLWAARSAAEHNYSMDPEKLYIGRWLDRYGEGRVLSGLVGCRVD